MPLSVTPDHFICAIDLKGKGHSSPVLWGKKLFLTVEPSAKEGSAREVVCFDADTGAVNWRKSFALNGYGQHRFNSFASATPVVDANGVYVAWTENQSSEVFSLDHEGNERWRTATGDYEEKHGSGSSLVLAGGVLILAKENLSGSSFIFGLDPVSGKVLWKIERPSERTPFSTPVVREAEGKAEVILASTTNGLTSVDSKTGKVNWKFSHGFEQRCVASPVVMGDFIFTSSGQGGGGKESVVVEAPAGADRAREAFRVKGRLPYVPTPIYYKGNLYIVSDGGIASCFDARTGARHWQERVCREVYGSPVCVGGNIYVFSRVGKGEAAVFKASETFRKVGDGEVGAPVQATPAVANGKMYIRSASQLICFGKKAPDSPKNE
ncbi:MAG: PQQ-binding-like beta-propeller repeat protein [Verrucomicrobiota bacterium]